MKKQGKKFKVHTDADLLELHKFRSLIVDSAPISILTIDKKGYITFANQYFRKFASMKQGVGKNVFHMKFFIREKLVPEYKKLLKEGVPIEKKHCPSKTPSGKIKYLDIIAVPLKDSRGRIEGALSMAIDVTKTVAAKMELHELNKSLKERVRIKTAELQDINEKLEKSLELKAKFISDASHELRTPLAIAKLNLEFLMDKCLSCKQGAAEALGEIDSEINRASEIISDISFFTSIDENSVKKLNMEKIDLNRFLGNLAKRVKFLADKKNISVIFKENELNPLLMGDRTKLEKLFLNIIGNSIKYGTQSGWTKISIEPDPEKLGIRVIILDNGIGIEKKDLPYIFTRFYRGRTEDSNEEGGFGLGLSICKWIVDQHKGFINVESTVGKGTTFAINLPIE